MIVISASMKIEKYKFQSLFYLEVSCLLIGIVGINWASSLIMTELMTTIALHLVSPFLWWNLIRLPSSI